jgi:hypothetical protein
MIKHGVRGYCRTQSTDKEALFKIPFVRIWLLGRRLSLGMYIIGQPTDKDILTKAL